MSDANASAPDGPEWRAWLAHAQACTAECRTVGRDCETAARLRQALGVARAVADRDTPR
jgi:hypothetical protein